MSDEFWDNLLSGHTATTVPSAVDQHLSNRGFDQSFESVRLLTSKGREETALPLPVKAGVRVSFRGTLGAYLSLKNPPPEGSVGEVVTVRSAGQEITSHDGLVFVKWDDGEFRSVHAQFLAVAPRKKFGPGELEGQLFEKGMMRIKAASLGDLTSFLKVAEGTLIHKSTKDLWKFSRDDDGGVLVERLFDSDGFPLKG